MNLLLGLLGQDGDRLTFSQIKAFDDNFAAHYGTSGYLHARIILRSGKVRCSDTQRVVLRRAMTAYPLAQRWRPVRSNKGLGVSGGTDVGRG